MGTSFSLDEQESSTSEMPLVFLTPRMQIVKRKQQVQEVLRKEKSAPFARAVKICYAEKLILMRNMSLNNKGAVEKALLPV